MSEYTQKRGVVNVEFIFTYTWRQSSLYSVPRNSEKSSQTYHIAVPHCSSKLIGFTCLWGKGEPYDMLVEIICSIALLQDILGVKRTRFVQMCVIQGDLCTTITIIIGAKRKRSCMKIIKRRYTGEANENRTKVHPSTLVLWASNL